MTDDSIVAEELSKSYGRVKALDRLNVRVRAGEIFGLVGANGAGKTTLIKILVGILRPDAGAARVLGLDPLRAASALRPQLGYMPQAPALYEDLTARENVRFFARGHHLTAANSRVEQILSFVELQERGDDLVHGFSGGMKQRLSLACTLVHRPRLLLLDEPTTGVDPRLRESLWTHFRSLTDEGATILLSTHQMDEVLHCDRVAIMRNGRVLATDTPRGLLRRGAATVTIWRDGESSSWRLTDYPEQLPAMLGLGEDVQRIEVTEATLEEVVLGLIADATQD